MSKDYILKEIKRTANENNGVPLGHRKFEAETGIRYHDWFGKYWARWGDALIEAGYKPNKLTSAYDENTLIEAVISFVREIGKLPSAGELRLRAHKSNGFPAPNTVQNRLGGNQLTLARRLLAYSEGKSEYSDIVDICSRKLEAKLQERSAQSFSNLNIEFGYVYLMKFQRVYKIGSSNNVGRRNYELGTKLPEELTIVHTIKTDDPTGIENYWQNRFKDKRTRGEYFALSNQDVAAFKRRKFM